MRGGEKGSYGSFSGGERAREGGGRRGAQGQGGSSIKLEMRPWERKMERATEREGGGRTLGNESTRREEEIGVLLPPKILLVLLYGTVYT